MDQEQNSCEQVNKFIITEIYNLFLNKQINPQQNNSNSNSQLYYKIEQLTSNKLKLKLKRKHLPMNKTINQPTFLHVKQRLDYYRLPTNFPYEATNLLARLFDMIDSQRNQKIYEKENARYGELKNENEKCCGETTGFSSMVDQAVKMELSKHVKQNNELHMTVMTLKEELEAMKHVQGKERIRNITMKNVKDKQNQYLEGEFSIRERELLNQLEDVKFKYNQLLDMVHSDDNTQKVYIKKLLKHKNYCSEMGRDTSSNGLQEKTRVRGVTTNGFKEASQERASSSIRHRDSYAQVSLLKQKLANRQDEIRRLHKKLQFDGISMNRILKDFNEAKAKEQRTKINQRVEHLQNQSHKQKEQNTKMKKQGGDKQALREHIDKLKEENLALKQKLQAMKRKQKQGEFDQKKQKRENQRKLNETSGNLQKMMKQKAKQEIKNNELEKREKLLEKRVDELAKELQNEKQQNKQLLTENQGLQKQLDSQKMMNQYQRQQFNQRQTQLTDRLNLVKQKQQVVNMGLLRQNQLLKETVGNLQRVQQQVLKRGSFIEASTIDKTVENNQQLNEFYRQQLGEVKNKLYAREGELIKKQNECLTLSLTVDKLRKQLQYIKGDNNSLRAQSLRLIQLQTRLSQLSQQLHNTKDLLQLQRSKTIKYQSQLTDYDKISSQFLTLKQQYFTLQKGQKERIRSLEMTIAQMEQVINLKVLKIQERDIRVQNLQAQVVEVSEKLRKANRELAVMDQQMHKLKMDKNRLEKKHSQLVADYNSRKQTQKTSSFLKQTQLLSEIDRLNRELHRYKLLAQEHEIQLNELTVLRQQNQRQLKEMNKLMDLQRQQIQNHKQRQQLYEMEIKELKEMVEDGK